jgi:hypothetical protein
VRAPPAPIDLIHCGSDIFPAAGGEKYAVQCACADKHTVQVMSLPAMPSSRLCFVPYVPPDEGVPVSE